MSRLTVGSAALLCACASPSATSTSQALRATGRITYYHQAMVAGPSILTRGDGSILDERRDEPFGAAIDGQLAVDPHNALNKETDPSTGWSDHGARWLAPDTARWLTPDPPVKAPDPKFMSAPWGLHPYQYVFQNPILLWDPDGREADHIEWKLEHDRLVVEHRQRMAAAVAAIGGARPGVTAAPAQGVPAPKIIAALDWNSRCTETQTAVFHPYVASKLRPLQSEARFVSELWGRTVLMTDENHNNAVDAFRHAYFFYRLTQIEDADAAKRWGDAHEVSVPSGPAERAMDLWNNAVGSRLATERPDADAFGAIQDAYRAGLLMTDPATGGAQAEPRPYEIPIVRNYQPPGQFR